MPVVTYIEANGNEHDIEVAEGATIMQGAVDNMIDAIAGECGGAGTCATCHCYVDPAWIDKVGTPDEMESQMLEMVLEPQYNSRLSCQIKVSGELDGIIIRLPKAQY